MNNATQTNTPKLFVRKSTLKLLDVRGESFLLCERSNGKRMWVCSAEQLDAEKYKEGTSVELDDSVIGVVKVLKYINSRLGRGLVRAPVYCIYKQEA